MRALFIGLGSIGTRHLKNLSDIAAKRGIELHADALRSGKGRILDPDMHSLLEYEYNDLSELPDGYDMAFICNPTSSHYSALRSVLDKSRMFFVEKPIFDKSSYDMEAFNVVDKSRIYVACPLRYSEVLKYIKSYAAGKKVLAVRSIC